VLLNRKDIANSVKDQFRNFKIELRHYFTKFGIYCKQLLNVTHFKPQLKVLIRIKYIKCELKGGYLRVRVSTAANVTIFKDIEL
jgi:hypothetical protein